MQPLRILAILVLLGAAVWNGFWGSVRILMMIGGGQLLQVLFLTARAMCIAISTGDRGYMIKAVQWIQYYVARALFCLIPWAIWRWGPHIFPTRELALTNLIQAATYLLIAYGVRLVLRTDTWSWPWQSSGDVSVKIWLPEGPNIGHAAMTLLDGHNTYISWWPSLVDRSFYSSGPKANVVHRARAISNRSFAEDCQGEGRQPDHEILVRKVDFSRVLQAWHNVRRAGWWDLKTCNCSTVIRDCLRAGSWLPPWRFWFRPLPAAPIEVAELCHEANSTGLAFFEMAILCSVLSFFLEVP